MTARLRRLSGQAVRFGMVGVANTALYYACYRLFLPVAPYLVAHVLAWCVAVVFSFFANCRFTYRVRPTWGRFVLFPLTTLAAFLVSTSGAVLLVEGAGVSERYATLIAGIVAIPVTFLLTTYVLTGAPTRERSFTDADPMDADPTGAARTGADRTGTRQTETLQAEVPQTGSRRLPGPDGGRPLG
ncbi:MAG: GtrA family protein [Dermatophilaceae bacterium]